MALFIRQDENRSKLQERLAAELREKAKARADTENPDGVADSQYLKETKPTTSLAGVWIAIIVAAGAAVVFLMFSMN